MEYDEMTQLLASDAFKIESHYTPDEFENTYFSHFDRIQKEGI
jgi:hypothetical protein